MSPPKATAKESRRVIQNVKIYKFLIRKQTNVSLGGVLKFERLAEMLAKRKEYIGLQRKCLRNLRNNKKVNIEM